MALIKPYLHHQPIIAHNVFLAENATLIGEVEIGENSSVWYQAVLRGDVGRITIGRETNIQDAAILHTTTGLSVCEVGDRVTVGHRAVLHGCKVEDEVLIGMGAIVLDNAFLPRHCIVAAGALVKENEVLESGFLYAGLPARKVKAISEKQIQMIQLGALHYVEVMGEH